MLELGGGVGGGLKDCGSQQIPADAEVDTYYGKSNSQYEGLSRYRLLVVVCFFPKLWTFSAERWRQSLMV